VNDTLPVEVQGIEKSFGPVHALRGIGFSVMPGEVFGLVGPDGAGKTTCMRILSSVMRPDRGRASILGLDTVSDPSRVKERIGYMSQRFGLYQDLTVDENVSFYADLYGVSTRHEGERIARLLDMSGMEPFRKRRAGRLSGGMKQKLGLICALVHTPSVLLLDEPTNGVDPVSRRGFWMILHELVEGGLTVLVSTSYLDEAERCDRVAFLHQGRIHALGEPGGLRLLVQGGMLEVVTSSPREAASILGERLPGARVVLLGDRVHISADSGPPPEVSAVTAALEGRIAFESVSPCEPGLEDVFVSLTEGTP
jgi:ABC-2 type transport system ATP-binding protein